MLTCAQGHENPDVARFCGTCGGAVTQQGDNSAASVDTDVVDVDVDAPEVDATDSLADDVDGADDADDADDDNDADDADDADDAVDADEEDLLDDLAEDEDLDDSIDFGDAEIVPVAQFSQPISSPSQIATTMDEVRQWASRNKITDDPYVFGLIEAVNNRHDLTMWAALDPFVHLPEPELNRGKLLRRIASVLLIVRNVLVFVPVALTWLAISKATDAFGDFVKVAEAGSSQNFLQFWQASESWWRIGDIALFDFLLIAGIVLATLAASSLNARAGVMEMKQQNSGEKERSRIAIAIATALQGKKQANPESIAESLAEALNDLTQAARDINVSAARLEGASVGVGSLSPLVDQLNIKMEQLVQQGTSGMLVAMEQLMVTVRGLDQTVSGGVAKLFEETLIGVQETNIQLARTSASVEFGTKQMREDLEALHNVLGSVTRGGR
jgi:hypothetical protein